MSDIILVTYASRSGSTAGVAEAIGRTLADGGLPVEIQPMGAVKDLSPYRAVVAGSAIRGQIWLPEAMQFLHANRTILNRKPFAAFLVCITLAMPGAANYRAGISGWMDPVRAQVTPVSVGLFAGALDLGKLTFAERLRMGAAVALHIFPAGDHRDWNAIHAWAAELPSQLIKGKSNVELN